MIDVLEGIGSEPAEAKIVASHMLEANLRGHDSHGVGMLVQYVKQAGEGKLIPNTPARVVNDLGVIVQLAGDRGFGQRTGRESTALAVDRARDHGLCLFTLSGTAHLGRIGTYGEQAVDSGMVALLFVNVNSFAPLVAPFNGSEPRFGTNPICISIPGTDASEPFILDFATSVIAQGKARVAHLAGSVFDEEVVVTPEGARTNDPTTIFEGEPRGALIAMAKHKGYGLAMACELLAGLLSGGGTMQPEHPLDGSIVNNMFGIVIDPRRLGDTGWMAHEYAAMVDYVKSSRQADPVNHPIQVAGEPERARRERRLRDGVAISDEEWSAVRDAAAKVGVTIS